MVKKKKSGEKIVIFELNTFDGSLPQLKTETTIKKSNKKTKKRDPKQDLETARMDAIE